MPGGVEIKHYWSSWSDQLRMRLDASSVARTIPKFHHGLRWSISNMIIWWHPLFISSLKWLVLIDHSLLRNGGQDFTQDVNSQERGWIILKDQERRYFWLYSTTRKTSQIFLLNVWWRMVDDLEKKPAIFDDPSKTFITFVHEVESYIAELVKRLYNSEGLKDAFPNCEEQLKTYPRKSSLWICAFRNYL